MKILIVCGEYFNQSNGLSLSTQRFVEQFKRLGDEVRVLSSDHGGISEYSVPVNDLIEKMGMAAEGNEDEKRSI